MILPVQQALRACAESGAITVADSRPCTSNDLVESRATRQLARLPHSN